MDSPKELSVSIWMISYNHELYIEQAIESVLAQKTNFKIELIIGEDNSTDNTASIIQDYANTYPEIIKVEFHKPGLGMMGNMLSTLNRCQGKYIALLEGDDYWTNEYKLQKQVDFMEAHMEMSFCFHNATVIYEDSSKPNHPFANLEERSYNGDEIISNWIVPTASVLFRNNPINFPKFAANCAHGDILLFLLLLENGEAHAFNDTWSVYRKNNLSITNKNQKNDKFIKSVIAQNKKMQSYFKDKYKTALKKQYSYWQLALVANYLTNKKYGLFLVNIVHLIINEPSLLIKKLSNRIH